MTLKSPTAKKPAEQVIQDIRRVTRRHCHPAGNERCPTVALARTGDSEMSSGLSGRALKSSAVPLPHFRFGTVGALHCSSASHFDRGPAPDCRRVSSATR